MSLCAVYADFTLVLHTRVTTKTSAFNSYAMRIFDP